MSTKTKKHMREYLKKVFGEDIEIVDATEPLRVIPQACDLEGAEAKNPFNCVLVHTGKRQFDCKAPVVWKTMAYFDFVGGDGKRRAYRHVNPPKTQGQITGFDRGQPWIEGSSFVFLPPGRAKRLAHKRKVHGRYLQTRQGKHRTAVKVAKDRLKAATVRLDLLTDELRTARTKKPDYKKLQTIKGRVRDQEKMVGALRVVLRKLDASVSEKPKWKKKPVTFDLTTRNGAAGHYNFVGAA